MVPNSINHIVLVSFRMQKRTIHTIQNTKCINIPHPTLPDDTHTHYNASWTSENQDLRRRAVECAEGAGLCVAERQRGLRPGGDVNLHPTPLSYKQNGVFLFFTFTTVRYVKASDAWGWRGKQKREEGRKGCFPGGPGRLRVTLEGWRLAR